MIRNCQWNTLFRELIIEKKQFSKSYTFDLPELVNIKIYERRCFTFRMLDFQNFMEKLFYAGV